MDRRSRATSSPVRRPTGAFALAAIVALSGCSKKSSCPAGQELCFEICVDLRTSPLYCGSCFHRCALGAACAGGTCGCPAALPDVCGAGTGTCVDKASDPMNCGACGHVCSVAPVAATCSGGSCACGAGATDCGGNPQCVDTATDPKNCGTCGDPCQLTREVCTTGTCGCPGTLPDRCPTVHPTACVNTQTDAANCGGCGNACPLTNEACVNATCKCSGSFPDQCGSACVNERTDPSNCGTCGNACPAGLSCSSGACTCPAGETNCSGACVDLQTSPANCGTCSNACGGGTCIAGHCCGAGAPVCGGTCCQGTACCPGDVCQTAHSNGLGQPFFDCNPLGTFSSATATEAADAWNPGTTMDGTTFCGPGCLGRQTATACAVWCYAATSLGQGFVAIGDATCTACPFSGQARSPWN